MDRHFHFGQTSNITGCDKPAKCLPLVILSPATLKGWRGKSLNLSGSIKLWNASEEDCRNNIFFPHINKIQSCTFQGNFLKWVFDHILLTVWMFRGQRVKFLSRSKLKKELKKNCAFYTENQLRKMFILYWNECIFSHHKQGYTHM